MYHPDRNTPVIIGVGCCQVRSDDPLDCPEPYRLMLQAIAAAARDAGCDELPRHFESIAVQKGSWKYSNPGRLLADALGCPGAHTVLADLGVLQLTPFFNLCREIAAGRRSLGVVTGGEARYRELRSLLTGQAVSDTEQPSDTPPPDEFFATPDPFSSELEQQRGIWAPGEFYAIADSAWRHHRGVDIDTHRDRIASLYSDFSRIAAANPHAWNRAVLSAEAIRTVDRKNAMVAFPYTKRVMSQWNVNQAVAVIVCSVARARELGLDEARWIYPLAAAQSRHVVALAQKPALHTHPGAVLTGQRALALAGATPADVTVADLYSCFPSAILCAADDLNLLGQCPLSVTGSMALAGGPFNHGALDSLARMTEVLRPGGSAGGAARPLGLVTNISGMFGKQACTLLSPVPGDGGFCFADVTEEVAALEQPLPIDAGYAGPATVVAYSVMYNKQDISHAIAYCDTPAGARTVVRTDDGRLAERMTREDFVGRVVLIDASGAFRAVAAAA